MPRTCHYMRPKRKAGAGVPEPRQGVTRSHEAQGSQHDRGVNELNGGLRVTTQRDWQPEVPCLINLEASHRFIDMQNPHNQCGPLLEDQVPVVTGSDWDSFSAAFNKRCNVTHKDDLEDDVYLESLSLLSNIKTQFEEWDENPADRSLWESKFSPDKTKRMRLAMQEADQATYSYLGTKDLSVKLEVLLKRDDPTWAARVIYAGNDLFNAMTGPAMMEVMRRLEVVLDQECIGTVKYCTAYKKSDVKLACFIEQDSGAYPHTVEGDYSANDKHQRERVHELFDLFLEKIRMPTWLRRIFLENNKFKVRSFKLGLQATLKNQLATGTTATTPRNSLYNILMFAVSCGRQGLHSRALVLGDDLLARTDEPMDLQTWVGTVDRFKMVLKAKAPRMRGGATFLSKRLVTEVETPFMVPLLGKALARFNARAIYKDDQTHSQYMAGKSLSYAYEMRHVPYLRKYFLARHEYEDKSNLNLEELSWNTKVSGLELDGLVQSILDEPVTISDDTFLDWVMETYSIGLCDVGELMEMIVMSDEPKLVSHPAVVNLSMDW
jgi:hypothetical protein